MILRINAKPFDMAIAYDDIVIGYDDIERYHQTTRPPEAHQTLDPSMHPSTLGSWESCGLVYPHIWDFLRLSAYFSRQFLHGFLLFLLSATFCAFCTEKYYFLEVLQ